MKVKKAFTLVEIIVVVVILGILATNVITTFRSYAEETKGTASKDNLRILRNTIQLYAVKHGDVPPGYTNDNPMQPVSSEVFFQQVVTDGHYLPRIPKNPFNDSNSITILSNGELFPAEAPGGTGWIYQPETRAFRLNSSGTDSDGARYYDY